MERYIEFNPIKFISESLNWENELKEREKELNTILELRGQSDSVGKGSEISNPTETINLAKSEIEGKIERLKCYQRIYKAAYSQLSEEDKMMIDGFFLKKYGRVRGFVEDYAKKNMTNKSYVYDARKRAMNNFAKYINEMYLR